VLLSKCCEEKAKPSTGDKARSKQTTNNGEQQAAAAAAAAVERLLRRRLPTYYIRHIETAPIVIVILKQTELP